MSDYPEFQKIPRYSREVLITEKIDGTNGLIQVSDDGLSIRAGSRTRWITSQDDNYGFAAWVERNKEELLKLGPGNHYGEWWGAGIQRKYGLKEKKFSLFNVSHWSESRPACCDVVPLLWRGSMDDISPAIAHCLDLLRGGSIAAPGFMKPEGIVIYHVAGGYLFKKTLEKDESPKGQVGKSPSYWMKLSKRPSKFVFDCDKIE